MGKVENGQTVSVHYVGTLDDGTEFDSSRVHGNPVSFEVGSGQLITGFDTALQGMTIGEVKQVHLTPDEAYGTPRPELLQAVPHSNFPPDFNFEVGAMVQGRAPTGQVHVARIDAVNDDTVVLDYNHPMAGKNLNFEIELLSIQ